MKNSKRKLFLKKSLAFAMALMVGVTFVPLLGNGVSAASKQGTDKEAIEVTTEGAEAAPGVERTKQLAEEIGVSVNEGDAPSETAPLTDITEARQLEPAVDDFNAGGLERQSEAEGEVFMAEESVCEITKATLSGMTYSLVCKIKKGYTGTYKFAVVAIDNNAVKTYDQGTTSLNLSIDMSGCSTGYHTLLVVVTKNGKADASQSLVHRYLSINKITDRPSYRGSFTVFHNYFNFYPYSFFANQSGNLYIEYSGNGGKSWARARVPSYSLIKLPTQQGYSISGLRANTNYATRYRYGEYVTYDTDIIGDGKTYFFGGPILGTGTYKTGQAQKPKIKSIKVKAVKVKKHKIKHPKGYYWYGNTLIYQKAWTEKYWTYKLKVTVKLKKKPKTAGIWLSVTNGVGTATYFLKGNKKKYSKKISLYPGFSYKKPPKGLKVVVSVRSAQNASYGGYSPAYSKKKKVKR